ncbi:MAG: hypothetical protein KBT27_09230 [Prevotellaceae bacterium]|nr:hypothetical protein [Candidatus Faecinaster equi]
MNVSRYTTIVKRNVIDNEMFAFGIIQGIQIALCGLDNTLTYGYDCELFEDIVIYRVDTTQDKYDIFYNTVKNIYPTLILKSLMEGL